MLTNSTAFDEAPIAPSTSEELAGPPVLQPQFGPVARQERINSLDVLRGFALMGILIMNITDFAMSYVNYLIPLGAWLPVFTGPHAKINTTAWMLRWILAEGKMRALFSMLFGAGAVLLTDRAESRGGGDRVADIFLRRNMWLVLIGFLHGFIIWNGDILFWYGITGLLFLYPMRKLRPKTLLKASGWLIFVWILIAGVGRTMGTWSTERDGKAAIAAANSGKPITEKQRNAIGAKVEQDKQWRPLRIDVEKSIVNHHGYLKAQGTDAKATLESQRAIYFGFLDVLIFMMIGMALYKNGFLTGKLSTSVYVKTAVIGYLIAIPITAVGVIQAWRGGFEIVSSTAWLFGPYDLCRVSGALANASVILLIVRAGALKWLTKRIAAVGQTALSNYLLTSIICQFLFVWGPTHWYQYIEYYKLYYIVAAVWAINLIWSPLWLSYFQFGPVEWVWRSLTYWKRQPMRLQSTATTV